MFLCKIVTASIFFALVATSGWAASDDYGPHPDLRALRHAAPILLKQRTLDEKLSAAPTIDGIVVSGNDAMVQWHAGQIQRLEYFSRRLNAWWLAEEIWIDEHNGSAMGPGGYYIPGDSNGPTVRFLLEDLRSPPELVARAQAHLSTVQAAMEHANAHPGPSHFHGDGYEIEQLDFGSAPQMPSLLGGYALTLRFATNDALAAARITHVSGRAPNQSESWIAPGGNSFFFFSGKVDSAKPIRIAVGAVLTVWFPFLLEESRRYSIAITLGNTVVGPVDGVLDANTNTMQFTLPGFSLPPGVDLSAEVEGDQRH